MLADPCPRSDAAQIHRVHPQTAWTAHRIPLGAEPEELSTELPSVAVLRLPDGWPLVLQGPPALLWQDLADAGEAGRTLEELAEPWLETVDPEQDVLGDLVVLFRSWEGQGLIETVPAP